MFDKAHAMGVNLSFRHCPDDEILPGVRFGRQDELLTPAYWAMRCACADVEKIDFVNHHGSLAEEIGFCLLGGFGVTLEVATAFYERLRKKNVFQTGENRSESDIFAMLAEPALVNGRPHKYRFPNQRARRISKAMQSLGELDFDTDPISFRNQIQTLEGVGPKTASWITRNWFDTDEVAILDIHVLRAGWTISLFEKNCRLPKDYLALEKRFIAFAGELHVRASVLDAVMWSDMRMFGSDLAREMAA
ncbi:hypothetical protein [Hyphococcus sp.]|jgi:thermostable 8-oxoguanine DNA glycosylase|uniref:8-oxoguanine DNA glycosylase n=1 Tax=Hyphococcus sp. TaxID=2038636 RepID=UPI003D0E4679